MDNENIKVSNIDQITVAASVLADLLGVTDRRIRQLAEEGVLHRVTKGRYSLPISIKNYLKMLRMEDTLKNDGEPDELDLEKERAIHERIKRHQSEIKLAAMKGTVHRAEDVEQVMTDMLTAFRTRLLNVPSKLAPTLVGRESAGEIREIITNEIVEVLGELKAYNPEDYYSDAYVDYDEDDLEELIYVDA